MPLRPYWTGQMRISLVTLPITLVTATRRSRDVTLHELDRETGERIHHKNVNEEGQPVAAENIVKAHEVEKNEYIVLEKDEIENLKLPSSDVLELSTFVDVSSIPLLHFERPYFILPDGKDAREIYDVISEALRATGKAGVGQIALRGREELCAVVPFMNGLLLETLRYASEMQELPEIYTEPQSTTIKSDYLKLAKQLIEQNVHDLDIARFHDRYREALTDLIEAKKENRAPRYHVEGPKPAKVVDFMDALRRSLMEGEKSLPPGKKRKSG